jgi:phosphoesterase RecJ-like protein
MIERVADAVRTHQDFAVVSHVRPDGDSLGSQLALALALESCGKSVRVMGRDPVPGRFAALPGADKVIVGDAIDRGYDAVFVLECGNLDRPGISGLGDQFVINIDHHHSTAPFGRINWIDPAACAVGEMVYRLISVLDIGVTPDIATNVYVAILTDTGSFQFPSTTAETFRLAADLADRGADVSSIAMSTFYANPLDKVRKMGILLNAMTIECDGRVVVTALTRDDLEGHGVSPDDTDIDGLINYPMTIRGVDVAILFQELRPGRYRVSLRSKSAADVSGVAAEFGGGGHRKAAGCQVSGPFETVRLKILDAVRTQLGSSPSAPL